MRAAHRRERFLMVEAYLETTVTVSLPVYVPA
jgi:hypothetical protein